MPKVAPPATLNSHSHPFLFPVPHLQKAHRKVLDVLNSVGLGETLLKLIERRQRMDIYMTYGGMVGGWVPWGDWLRNA